MTANKTIYVEYMNKGRKGYSYSSKDDLMSVTESELLIGGWMDVLMQGCVCGWMNGPKEAKREVACKYCALGHFVLENIDSYSQHRVTNLK